MEESVIFLIGNIENFGNIIDLESMGTILETTNADCYGFKELKNYLISSWRIIKSNQAKGKFEKFKNNKLN